MTIMDITGKIIYTTTATQKIEVSTKIFLREFMLCEFNQWILVKQKNSSLQNKINEQINTFTTS